MVKCENCSSTRPLLNPTKGLKERRATSGWGWLGLEIIHVQARLRAFFSRRSKGPQPRARQGKSRSISNHSFRRIEAMLQLSLVFFFRSLLLLAARLHGTRDTKGVQGITKSDKRVLRQAKSIHPLTSDRVRSFVLGKEKSTPIQWHVNAE